MASIFNRSKLGDTFQDGHSCSNPSQFARVETAGEGNPRGEELRVNSQKQQAYRFARLPAPSSVSHLPVALPFRM